MLVRRIFIGLVVALLLNVIYNTVSPATTTGPMIKKKSATSSSDAITDAKTIDDFQKKKQSSGNAKTASERREEENRGKTTLAQDEHRSSSDSSSSSGASVAGDNSNGKSQQDAEDEPKTDGNADDDAGGAATATGPGNTDNDDTGVDAGNENATHPNDHFAKNKKVVVGRVSMSDALGQERRVQELMVYKLRERARKMAAQRHKKLGSDPELAQNGTALKLLHSPPLDKVVGFRQMASSFLNKSFAATARRNLFVYDTVWPAFPEVLSSSIVTDQKSHILYGGAEGSQSVPDTNEATLASRGKSGQKAPKTPPTFTPDGIQEDVTEGHCNVNSDKFNIFSQEFSDTETRVLRLMDKFDALEQSIRDRVESLDNTTTDKKFETIDAAVPKNDDPFVRKALAQQHKISRLVEAELRAELRDGEKVAEDHAAGGSNANATKAGEHPTIRWMRKSRWLLDVFVPFMDEQSCVPVGGASSSKSKNDTSSSAPPPPSAYQFHVRKSTKEVWAFYNFNNVCVNSETGGLSAVFPPTMEGLEYYGVNDLTEERRLKVRNQLFIWNRAKMNRTNPIPKCFVDVPILLHPILFQSDNLGHVLYRILATRSLLSDFTKVKNQGYEKTVLGFLVAHSSQKTFALNNKYRMWYQMLGHRWFSVKASGNVREHTSNLPKGSEENEICFKRVFLGWSIVPMYQKRSGRIANKDLRINGPAVQRFRNRVDACYDMPARPVHQGSGAVSDDDEGKRLISASGVEKKKPTTGQTNGKAEEKRPRITIVTRRTRRILNQAEFAHRIAARYPDADVHVADFEGMTVHQQVNITHNTDVLISIHGTALQYVLNQPPNGVMVEIQYSTGKYYCTNPGINPANRIFCEFGRTSTVARVTHIVHRVTTKNTTGCNMKTFHDCDVTLTVDAQNEIIDSAMCSLQAGFVKATKECNANTRKGQSMISDALK